MFISGVCVLHIALTGYQAFYICLASIDAKLCLYPYENYSGLIFLTSLLKKIVCR